MATRFGWFVAVSLYLIFANILVFSINATILNTYNYDTSDIASLNDTTTQSSLKANAQIFWDLMTFNTDVGSSTVFFILITIPSILWLILLATFVIPTVNAGS